MFHPLECFVGSRYVWSRRRRGLVSFMSAASLCGVALGVAALIIVLSIMNGLEAETRDRLLSLSAHATLSAPGSEPIDFADVVARLEDYAGIVHVAPFVSIEGMLSSGSRLLPTQVRGVDPVLEGAAFPEDFMVEGSFSSLVGDRDGIVIGRALAANLGVTVGDQVTLLHARIEGEQPRPSLEPLRIVGVFSARIADHDAGLALIHIDRAQSIAGGPQARALGIRVAEPLDIARFRGFVESQGLLASLTYSDWSDEHRSHFRAIRIEKTMITLMLALIVAVAAFNIVASLMMVVNSKSTDIAILRTLGLEPRRVAGIFVFQGSLIGVSGMLIGTVIGVIAALNVATITPQIEAALGFQIMPADVYYISQIPSQLQWTDVVWIDLLAFAIALAATIYPSRKAAGVAPAAALRYE